MVPVNKTYKAWINGKFIRSESGRHYLIKKQYNIPQCSRKDLRNAIAANIQALPSWQETTAYNKGQILYRASEMLYGRLESLKDYVSQEEINNSLSALIYFAGCADKLSQLGGSVNQVTGPYFNFTTPEPMGVIGVISPLQEKPLSSPVSSLAAAICGGNTVTILLSELQPLPGLILSEILQNSDIPNGVVNILSGKREELIEHFFTHRGINALDLSGCNQQEITLAKTLGADSLKRVSSYNTNTYPFSPRMALQWQELKTVWHSIGK